MFATKNVWVLGSNCRESEHKHLIIKVAIES